MRASMSTIKRMIVSVRCIGHVGGYGGHGGHVVHGRGERHGDERPSKRSNVGEGYHPVFYLL